MTISALLFRVTLYSSSSDFLLKHLPCVLLLRLRWLHRWRRVRGVTMGQDGILTPNRKTSDGNATSARRHRILRVLLWIASLLQNKHFFRLLRKYRLLIHWTHEVDKTKKIKIYKLAVPVKWRNAANQKRQKNVSRCKIRLQIKRLETQEGKNINPLQTSTVYNDASTEEHAARRQARCDR